MNDYHQIFRRVESKYILTEYQFYALRQYLEKIAEVDRYGETDILNLYFDTPDYYLIRSSIEGGVYKEKLRLRSYGIPAPDSDVFLEIKKKYQGVVYKRRVAMPCREALDFIACRNSESPLKLKSWEPGDGSSFQILREIDWFFRRCKDLQPRMAISYRRVAMAGIEDPDFRVTFDRDIRWRTGHLDLTYGDEGRRILPKGLCLMELKIAGAIDLDLAEELSRLKIFPVSFSKYGRGYQAMLGQLEANGQRPVRVPVPSAGHELVAV